MRTLKSKPFTKQKMISDIKELKEDCITRAMSTQEISIKYKCLYNYKIFKELFELNFLKIHKKIHKKTLYKWNFDRKVDVDLYDSLYKNAVNYRTEMRKKSVISQRIKKQNDLKKDFQELSFQNTIDLNEKSLKKEDENLKKNIFGKSLMRKCLYSGNLFIPTRPNQLFENTKARTNYHNSYYRSVDKIIKETNEKEKKDLLIYVGELEQKIKNLELELHNYKSDISNDDLKKQNPKSFIENTKQKPIKYLKLFGIKIYEKN